MSSAGDSAESHSECRKGRKDIWNIHKKAKENSKGIGKGTKKTALSCDRSGFPVMSSIQINYFLMFSSRMIER